LSNSYANEQKEFSKGQIAIFMRHFLGTSEKWISELAHYNCLFLRYFFILKIKPTAERKKKKGFQRGKSDAPLKKMATACLAAESADYVLTWTDLGHIFPMGNFFPLAACL
jgi:hypothetical protein